MPYFLDIYSVLLLWKKSTVIHKPNIYAIDDGKKKMSRTNGAKVKKSKIIIRFYSLLDRVFWDFVVFKQSPKPLKMFPPHVTTVKFHKIRAVHMQHTYLVHIFPTHPARRLRKHSYISLFLYVIRPIV